MSKNLSCNINHYLNKFKDQMLGKPIPNLRQSQRNPKVPIIFGKVQ